LDRPPPASWASPGAAGILVARRAGRWTDRVGVKLVVLAGICSMVAAWVAMGFGELWIAAVVRRRDAARHRPAHGDSPQSNAGQHRGARLTHARKHPLRPAHVERNAVDAFLTSWTSAHYGWLGVCGVAMTATITALLINLGVLPVGKTEAAP
jgi:hypothetical protein